MAATLRLRPEAQSALDDLVDEEGLSANEIINRAILERAARHGHRAKVRAAWSEIDGEYAELFERLRRA